MNPTIWQAAFERAIAEIAPTVKDYRYKRWKRARRHYRAMMAESAQPREAA